MNYTVNVPRFDGILERSDHYQISDLQPKQRSRYCSADGNPQLLSIVQRKEVLVKGAHPGRLSEHQQHTSYMFSISTHT
jgi:hypothetical protein